MLFFCPLDNPRKPTRTTLDEQRALLSGWERKRHGLVVDAATPRDASLTMEAYLIDCHRSGRPGYEPSVSIEERDGVPVASLTFWPGLGDDGAAAIDTMVAAAKRRMGKPVALTPAHIAKSNHCAIDSAELSLSV